MAKRVGSPVGVAVVAAILAGLVAALVLSFVLEDDEPEDAGPDLTLAPPDDTAPQVDLSGDPAPDACAFAHVARCMRARAAVGSAVSGTTFASTHGIV